MRELNLALALAASVAVASTMLMPAAGTAQPLSAADDKAGIFRIIDLKGSAVKWGSPQMGTGATVTYAFATEAVVFSKARNCSAMEPIDALLASSGVEKAVYEAEAAKAFDEWAQVADIRFRQVSDVDMADILIGAQSNPVGRAFTNVSYTGAAASRVRALEKSLICLNPEQPWKVGFDGDLNVYDLRYTLKHEIGHAIGLDHPGTPTQVMSYRYEERFATLQPGDVRGAVALYGSPRELMVETVDLLPVRISGAPVMPIPDEAREQQYRALGPARD